MTTPLQGLLGPFQTPGDSTAVRVVQPGQQDHKRILLAFGRAGAGRVMQASFSLHKTFYCTQHVVEKTQAETDLGPDPDFGGGLPSGDFPSFA